MTKLILFTTLFLLSLNSCFSQKNKTEKAMTMQKESIPLYIVNTLKS